MSDGSTLTTTTERGPMNRFVKRSTAVVHDHKKTIGLIVGFTVLIAAALILYFTVLKKRYRGGSSSKGSTRLVFQAQTQTPPTTGSADSKTTPAVDLKSMAKTIQSDLRTKLNSKDVWVYSAAYPDALWVANNDASFKSGNVALYKNKIPKTCVSAYKDSTATSFVVDGSAKTVTTSTSAPAWGLFVVETSATSSAVTAAAAALTKSGSVNYGTASPAAANADAAKTAVCMFTAAPKSS